MKKPNKLSTLIGVYMTKYIFQAVVLVGATSYAALMAPSQTSIPGVPHRLWDGQDQVVLASTPKRTDGDSYDLFGPDTDKETKRDEGPAANQPNKPDSSNSSAASKAPSPVDGGTGRTDKVPETYIINFTATWCGPCKKQKPILHQLEQEGHKVIFVDIDEKPQLASSWKVSSIPVTVVVRNGHIVSRYTGVTGYSTIKSAAGKP